MRIAVRWSEQRLSRYLTCIFSPVTYSSRTLLAYLSPRPACRDGYRTSFGLRSFNSAAKDNRTNKGLQSQDLEINIGLKQSEGTGEVTEHGDHAPISSLAEDGPEELSISSRSSPYSWMVQLDPFLPARLRVVSSKATSASFEIEDNPEKLLGLLEKAQVDAGEHTDLLAYMTIQHGRSKAVMYLVDLLVKPITNHPSYHNTQNSGFHMIWQGDSLDKGLAQPITLQTSRASSRSPGSQLADEYAKAMQSEFTSAITDRVMSQIWFFLGNLVIKASCLRGELAQQVMNTFYQVLAQIHNRGLVPENIYAYEPKAISSVTQRPPILHLLSSRILTALSDAVWRSHSDNLILEIAELGTPYQQIGKDPPGGRFRLKVRDLGPEVWLEFVLWCCVERGFGSSAAKIVRSLHLQASKPWFAVHWTSTRVSESRAPTVDWDRVKLRYGGSVGIIEGYSHEHPFVEMPSHTISAEVVISIAEVLINSISSKTAKDSSATDEVRQEVEDVISFLEPHGLPADYFDYLIVRVFQTDSIDSDQHTDSLRAWIQTFSKLRNLQPVEQLPLTKATLNYGSILDHSVVQVAVLHQSLQASIHRADVNHSLEVFAQIQQSVDRCKLQVVESFLEDQGDLHHDSSKSNWSTDRQEFINSYGQLPPYKRAAFLNLVSDSKLLGLGNWLLYTQDVDGSVIPRDLYSATSVATSLIRYAAASNDEELTNRVLEARKDSKLKPSVNLLRNLFNASVTFLDFDRASRVLSQVQFAAAGGYSPKNLAYLSNAILRLESELITSKSPDTKLNLDKAVELLRKLLAGTHLGSRGDFNLGQVKLFRNQIGHLLRVCASLDVSILSNLAKDMKGKYPSSNDVRLAVSTFNTLLDGIVENLGVDEGKRMWDLFCKDPRSLSSSRDNIELASTSFDETASPISNQVYRTQKKPRHESVITDHDLGTVDMIGSRDSRQLLPTEHNSSNLRDGFTSPSEMVNKPVHRSSFLEEGRRISAEPIVVPNVQTLRIIVRGALRERRYLAEHAPRMIQGSYQTSVLKWATQMYRAFGWSKSAIERETQERLAVEPPNLFTDFDIDDDWRWQLMEKPSVDLSLMFSTSSLVTRMPIRT